MATVFLTGFPGFLGAELLPRILAGVHQPRAVCLVQPRYAELARRRAFELQTTHPQCQGRIELLEGDITRPGLGLGATLASRRDVAEIYHLAAIYDLGVAREAGMRVNVEGTRNMLQFAGDCPSLERFHYISTCYVSGTHAGSYSEKDLDLGQGFHNFYEETKFLAELAVQERMREGLPVTIYRPVIVVGDSATGTTQKYDGPYYVIRLLLRQPRLAMLPVIGDPTKTEVNLAPSDFVVRAIAFLSQCPGSRNRVFHLADPEPLTTDQAMGELARATGRRLIRVPVPLRAAKVCLSRVPGMSRLIGIPADALDYFAHPAHYATAQTQAALSESGIRCPRFSEYVDRLVKFVVAHPEVGSAAMA